MSKRNLTMIEIEVIINAPVASVWHHWNDPESVKQWNYASKDWHTTKAVNEFRNGGRFIYTMAAKDGSVSFNFSGVYEKIIVKERIDSLLDDQRRLVVSFVSLSDTLTKVVERFQAEEVNAIEHQRFGWQSILENFKSYVEANI